MAKREDGFAPVFFSITKQTDELKWHFSIQLVESTVVQSKSVD